MCDIVLLNLVKKHKMSGKNVIFAAIKCLRQLLNSTLFARAVFALGIERQLEKACADFL